MGEKDMDKLKKWVVAAATVAMLGITGYMVGDWDEKRGYPVVNILARDTLWAEDSMRLVFLADSLLNSYRPTNSDIKRQKALWCGCDYAYVYTARGNKKEWFNSKDGMVNGVIEPNKIGYDPFIFGIPEKQAEAFCHFKIDTSEIATYRAAADPNMIVDPKQVVSDSIKNVYRAAKKLVNYDSLAKSLKIDSLKYWAHEKKRLPVFDARSVEKSILKNSDTLNPNIADVSSISTGGYTIGAGGGYNYLCVDAFFDDFINFTGNMACTLKTSVTQTNIANCTENSNTDTLFMINETGHNGDPTAGNIYTLNLGTENGITFGLTNAPVVVMRNWNIHRIGTGAAVVHVNFSIAGGGYVIFHDNIVIDYTNIHRDHKVFAYNTNSSGEIYNNVIVGGEFGMTFTNAIQTTYIENNTVWACSLVGISATLEPCTLSNNVVDSMLDKTNGNCYHQMDNAASINNASEDATGDTINIVSADEFVSTDSTSSDFLKLKAGRCDSGGAAPKSAGDTLGIRANQRPGIDGDYSQGADEYEIAYSTDVFYWISDGTGAMSSDWSDADNWSYYSGGSGGDGIPTTGDTAHFDANSSSYGCTLSQAIEIEYLDFADGWSGSGVHFSDGGYKITAERFNYAATGNSGVEITDTLNIAGVDTYYRLLGNANHTINDTTAVLYFKNTSGTGDLIGTEYTQMFHTLHTSGINGIVDADGNTYCRYLYGDSGTLSITEGEQLFVQRETSGDAYYTHDDFTITGTTGSLRFTSITSDTVDLPEFKVSTSNVHNITVQNTSDGVNSVFRYTGEWSIIGNSQAWTTKNCSTYFIFADPNFHCKDFYWTGINASGRGFYYFGSCSLRCSSFLASGSADGKDFYYFEDARFQSGRYFRVNPTCSIAAGSSKIYINLDGLTADMETYNQQLHDLYIDGDDLVFTLNDSIKTNDISLTDMGDGSAVSDNIYIGASGDFTISGGDFDLPNNIRLTGYDKTLNLDAAATIDRQANCSLYVEDKTTINVNGANITFQRIFFPDDDTVTFTAGDTIQIDHPANADLSGTGYSVFTGAGSYKIDLQAALTLTNSDWKNATILSNAIDATDPSNYDRCGNTNINFYSEYDTTTVVDTTASDSTCLSLDSLQIFHTVRFHRDSLSGTYCIVSSDTITRDSIAIDTMTPSYVYRIDTNYTDTTYDTTCLSLDSVSAITQDTMRVDSLAFRQSACPPNDTTNIDTVSLEITFRNDLSVDTFPPTIDTVETPQGDSVELVISACNGDTTAVDTFYVGYTFDTTYMDSVISQNKQITPIKRQRVYACSGSIDSIRASDTTFNWKTIFLDSIKIDTVYAPSPGYYPR